MNQSLERVTWASFNNYGEPDFESNLRFLSGSDNYFIQIVHENNHEVTFSLDRQGRDSIDWAGEIIPEDLFELLDDNEGIVSVCVEDSLRAAEWAIQAIVADREGNREVLVVSKSLANADYLIQLLYTRILFALFALVIIAAVVSFIITRRFTKPIEVLTKSAEMMAKGNYIVTFPKGGFYEVNQLSDTLEITEDLRREFVANLSHDMKTPLTVIRMYAEMIQTVSGNNKEKREAHLQQIVSEAEKLTAFINDTLELAKIQSGTMTVNKEIFEFTNVLHSVLLSFEVHQELEGFEIMLDIDPPFYVSADQKLIIRVLENFLSNAVKFSASTKKVMVSAKKRKGEVLVFIRNYGIGIPKEQLSYVWDRYYKVEPYEMNKGGTGVGLHIVKEILKQHDIPFGVESEDGTGSR